MRLVVTASLVFAAALATAARGAAAESKAPAAASPHSEDAIRSAKRDFELLKAARDPLLQGKEALPKIAAPDFTSPVESAPRLPKKSEKDALLEKQKKSANWLVEAMEKKPDARDPRHGTGRERLAIDGERGRDGELSAEQHERAALLRGTGKGDEPAQRDAAARDEKEKPRTEPAFNPLNRFMADWMTPQDFALLKPVLENSRAGGSGGAASGPAAGAPISSEFALPSTPEATLGLIGGGNRSSAPAAPQENPYLQAINLPAPSATMTPPAMLPPVVPVASQPTFSPVPPAITPVAPKSKVPDFARPAQDEKHFKQLKRF